MRPRPHRRLLPSLLAVSALVLLLVGGATHHHAVASGLDPSAGCVACALHQTTSPAAPPTVADPPDPPVALEEAPGPSVRLAALSPLSVAPKTSPPA